jgi:hypothetical protein
LKLQADVNAHIQAYPSLHLRAALKRNTRKFLAKVETDPFPAQNFADARRLAFKMVAPMLSQWSVDANVPLSIYRTDIIELATNSRRLDIVAPFPETQFVPPPPVHSGPKFRGYSSLYRESLNTTSPAYSFLCLYRILEGLRKDRNDRGFRARNAGTEPPKYRTWKVPSNESQVVPWLNALYRLRPPWDSSQMISMFPIEARGVKINKVVDDLYKLRCKIAHAIAGDPDNVGDFWEESVAFTDEIETWMPLTQMITRRMLKDEFPTEFLVDLPDDDLGDL